LFAYLTLALAIAAEVIATSAVGLSNGFTRLTPALIAVCGYSIAFYSLSLTLKTMHVGIAYAIWSGSGIILLAVIGWFFLNQKLDTPALIGIALIIAGVAVINLLSTSVGR
jgi:small multidrug resistance pump